MDSIALTEDELRAMTAARSALLLAESAEGKAIRAREREDARMEGALLFVANLHGITGPVSLSADGLKIERR